MAEVWDDEFDYLLASRGLYHNADYWRFLVRDVWRIDQRPLQVVDFGCGYGWLGHFLAPMLAAGSRYVGLDRAEALLRQGRALAAQRGVAVELVRADATAAPFADNEFDVAIAHTVLMHMPDAAAGLAEMARVTRPGGLVIACECTRNAINALIHIHETDEIERTPLGLFQKMNADVRRRTGVDYNIGVRMPVLMAQAGLTDIGARISDAVVLSFPPVDTPEKERRFQVIMNDGLGVVPEDEAALRRAVEVLMTRGASEAEAEAELRREIANDYRHKGRDYHIVQPTLITISYGTVSAG